MTYYYRAIARIRSEFYRNDGQIRRVIAARRYIDNNLDQPITLDQLARYGHTSKFHFLRTFKRYYGQTPKQYLTGKRIEKAKDLLRSGRGVTDTCLDVGYEDPASFCTLFRSRVGVTPSEFRKMSNFHKAEQVSLS